MFKIIIWVQKGLIPIVLPYVDIENKYIVSRGDKGILLYRAYENSRFLSMLGFTYYVPRTKNMDYILPIIVK